MSDDYASLVRQGDVWVAENGSGLVGLLVLEPANDHLLVQNVAVAPEAQGLGLGGLLLEVAEDQARLLGLPELRLYTNMAMEENLAYYPRRGYQEIERITQDGYHRVVFRKLLDG